MATKSPSGLPSLELKHLFTLECAVGTPLEVGDGGMGSSRRVIPITGGRFYGQISGEVMNLGFDALVMQSDMTAKPDAKYVLKTDEGEYILVESLGVRYPPGITNQKGEEAKRIASQTHVSGYTFQVKLSLETGAPRLAYLNKAIIVGSAKRTETNVSYDAYIVHQHVPSKL